MGGARESLGRESIEEVSATPSSVKAEPEFKKQRLEEESAKRPRKEGPETSPSSTAGMTSHEQMIERRVQKVCIGDEGMYHLDEVIESENIEMEVDEDVPAGAQEQDQPEVWSEAALTRTPPQPSDEVEALADQIEERRLKSMGVIEDLKEAEQEHLGSEGAAADDDVEMDGSETESWHPPPAEIPVVKFNHWNTLRSRAALRARQDLMVLEASWFHYTREGNSRQAGRLYELMEEMFEYIPKGECEVKSVALIGETRYTC